MNPFRIISVVLIALLFTSCNKDEEQASGVGDALVVVKKSGTKDVYGITLYAYTFSSFKTVSASSSAEAGKTYTLKANQGYKTNFYFETPDPEFTATKPTASTFKFSALFENGMTDEFQDELTDKVLATAIIDTCQFSAEKNSLRLSWQPVVGTDSYSINILDGSTLVFGSVQFVNSVKAVSISAKTNGWIAGYSPVNGKTYQVKLFAYLYETAKSAYDIQSVSIGESSAVWGE